MASINKIKLPDGITYDVQDVTSGYIKTETDPTVPSWAKATSKPTYTAAEVGLGNVGNFKAVSTVASQGLTSTEQANARANIGAGTSSFSGSYNDLSNKPTIPTVTDTYSSTGTAATSGKAVAAALGTLDGSVSGSAGSGKTLTAFSQTDGKVSATFGNISITKSQVSDLGTIGTAAAKAYTTSVTSGSADLVTSGAVYSAIDALPEPMVFKGTVGTNGTVTTLPTNGTASIGDTYKVITAGTYGGKVSKVGDTLVCLTKTSSANTWEIIPSGDDVEDTWRNIKVNGTEKLGTGISTGAVDFVNGTNTTVSFNSTGNKMSINAIDTKYTANTTSIGSASAGTAIPADDITAWSAGTLPSITITSTACDDITAWSAGTAASASVSNGVLIITNGTAPSLSYTAKSVGSASAWSAGTLPSLSYTAKSIPNISVTSTTVATGITES